MSMRRAIAATLAALGITAGGYLGVSDDFLPVMQRHEGKRNYAYPDVAYGWQMPTICFGQTAGVKRGDYRTDAECVAWMKQDVAAKHVYLRQTLPDGFYLSRGESNAYTSLVYNLKPKSWETSTARKRLIAGDRWGACLAATRFIMADGRPYPGLIHRRYDEYNECISNLPLKYAWPSAR